MAYATPTQLLERYDARTVGDLAADDGKRVVHSALLTDTNVAAALDDASGEIEAALLQGKRYSTADLTALTGNSAKYLVRITCDIAFALLWERRPWAEDNARAEAIKRAREALDRLRKGEHVFDVTAVKEAGLPSIDGPSTTDLRNLNLLRDRVNNFYPARHLPDNR